ncbi:uncharacterized protein JN550_005276 [Neoarthrinium moseri]|uniref:uncharacterized protein n=1 Tax=Neoarthrinium moseri TaxID=1658444 RepID=UPI001FDB13A6|nr:uncharacterized protein JN550_005276 [Neoarthrinium moseri]KAI1870348.1 hypothetical protein JN550_005276 [Neoarthrinium moseri]
MAQNSPLLRVSQSSSPSVLVGSTSDSSSADHSASTLLQPAPSHHYAVEGFFEPDRTFPEELDRIPSGSSVLDAESVVGDFGRTYHQFKQGRYLLPNDGAEQDRLDFQHAGMTVLLGGEHYLAPVSNPKHAIDIGTVTGIWAIDFAEKHPECQVVGSDLSAIQPPNAPSNCAFVKDDAEEEWLFPWKFDFVHLRFVFTCFNDHRRMMREAFKSMNSGAWIEYQDFPVTQIGSMDGQMEGSALQRWAFSVMTGMKTVMGRDIDVVSNYAMWLQEIGFVDVQEKKLIWPLFATQEMACSGSPAVESQCPLPFEFRQLLQERSRFKERSYMTSRNEHIPLLRDSAVDPYAILLGDSMIERMQTTGQSASLDIWPSETLLSDISLQSLQQSSTTELRQYNGAPTTPQGIQRWSGGRQVRKHIVPPPGRSRTATSRAGGSACAI